MHEHVKQKEILNNKYDRNSLERYEYYYKNKNQS